MKIAKWLCCSSQINVCCRECVLGFCHDKKAEKHPKCYEPQLIEKEIPDLCSEVCAGEE